MAEVSWDVVYKVSFKPLPVTDPVKKAVQLLRDTAKMNLDGMTTMTTFPADMRKILSDAIWKDVKAAIKQLGAPEIYSHAKALHGGTPIPVGIKTLEKAMGESGGSQIEQITMLLVLARCVSERIAVIKDTLLTQPED